MAPEARVRAIEQVWFGYDDADGMSPLAHSFEDEGTKLWVARRLIPHIRLSPAGSLRPPATALSYLHLDGSSAAVLYRVDCGVAPGRTNSHALIGPVGVVTSRLAIGLRNWSGWCVEQPKSTSLPLLTPSGLTAEVEDLPWRSPELADQLDRVLAQARNRQGLPLSIVGCAYADTLPLLAGLLTSDCPHLRDATFSTYETEHHDALRGLPEVVFLPVRPTDGRPARRALIDLERPRPSGRQPDETLGEPDDRNPLPTPPPPANSGHCQSLDG